MFLFIYMESFIY